MAIVTTIEVVWEDDFVDTLDKGVDRAHEVSDALYLRNDIEDVVIGETRSEDEVK
jgi:hypothetical protein